MYPSSGLEIGSEFQNSSAKSLFNGHYIVKYNTGQSSAVTSPLCQIGRLFVICKIKKSVYPVQDSKTGLFEFWENTLLTELPAT